MGKNIKPTVGIVGGTHGIGNWFKIFFEKNNYNVLISGRKTKLTNTALAEQSDIVIISVPIAVTIEVIKEIIPHLKDNSLLMDFTSLKKEPIEEMKKAKKTIGVIGLHPMFGPLVKDIKGQYIGICPKRENKLWKQIKELFEKNKANLIYIEPNEHDRQMALIQALVHFINLAYVKTLLQSNIDIKGRFSTPIFRFQTMICG